MTKQTTAQVAKALGITKQQIHVILHYYPDLRPSEQVGRWFIICGQRRRLPLCVPISPRIRA